jgi:hypothetical protein
MIRLRSGLGMALVAMIIGGGLGCGGSTAGTPDAGKDSTTTGTGGGGSGGGGTAGGGSGGGTAGGGTAGGGSGGGGSGGGGSAGGGTAGTDAGTVVGDGATDKGDAVTSDATDVKVDTGSDTGTDGGDAGDAHDGGVTCTNVCTLGGHQCGTNGGTQTCVAAASGCTVWGAEAACGTRQTCAGGVCACNAAPTGCTAAGTFCGDTSTVKTCATDGDGCRFIATTAVCPTNETCKGTLPTAACSCDNECAVAGAFCVDASHRATCTADGNTPACRTITSPITCLGSQTCAGGACVCPAIGTTSGTGCATLNATSCSGDDILTCVTETASGCSIWQASTHCGLNGGGRLTCGTKGGPPACQCPANAGDNVFVDPTAGSDTAAGLFPTGVQTPAACRYQSLTKGIASVAAAGTVTAISATLPASFTAETFPLAVPAGVTLTTADAVATPADYVITYNAAATTAVTLAAGSTLKGLSVVNDHGNTTATLVSCAAGAVTLSGLDLDGAGAVSDGLDVLGTCAASLNAVLIQGVTAVALDANSSGTSTISGGALTASLVGLRQRKGVITATNVIVDQNGHEGIALETGTPSLTLMGGNVSENGFTGGNAGVRVSTGALTATGTSILANDSAGVSVAAGTTVSLTSVTTSGSVTGLLVNGGNVTAAALTAGQNTSSGVIVAGGTVALTGATNLNANTANGLALTGGSASLTGGVVDGNMQNGISCSNGTLTVQGGAEVRNNTSAGLSLAGCTATVTTANIHGNLGDGVSIDSGSAASISLGAPGSATTIATNSGNGVVVHQSPPNGSDANTVTIDTAAITGNKGTGVYLQGDTGAIGATLRNNAISGNHDTGILIEEAGDTTREAIQNNDVSGNNTASGHSVGGVFFNTASTLTSMVTNKIHSNTGDELGFAARSNAPVHSWTIAPAGDVCGATSNTVSCYGVGNVGLRLLGVVPIDVDADGTRWASATPANGVDYSQGSGTVTATGPCADPPTATCP